MYRISTIALTISLWLSLAPSALAVPPTDEEIAELERRGIDVVAFFEDIAGQMTPPEDTGLPSAATATSGLEEIRLNFGLNVAKAPQAKLIDFNKDGLIDERDVLALGFREATEKRTNWFPSWPDTAPPTGQQRSLMILCQFIDDHAQPEHDWEYWNTLMNSEGVLETGSFKEYWGESSYGQLETIVDVWDYGSNGGWVTLPNTREYYTGWNYEDLISDAVDLVDTWVWFPNYDNDDDGMVDSIFFIYPGDRLDAGKLWPHKGWIDEEIHDGVKIRPYFVSDEEGHLGVLAHEHAHAMGVWDLYDYTYNSRGIGYWGLQGSGGYNNNEDSPAYSCPHFKEYWGWIDIPEISENTAGLVLNPYETTGDAYKILPHADNEYEYFLVTNMTANLNHQYLPGHGMMIWHVDESKANNDTWSWKYVDVEAADGRQDMDYYVNRGDADDPFPLDTKNEFTSATNPDSSLYSGELSKIAIKNISQPGEQMTFDVVYEDGGRLYPLVDGFEEGVSAWEVTKETGNSDWTVVDDKSSRGEYSIRLFDQNLDRLAGYETVHLESGTIFAATSSKPVLGFDMKTDMMTGEAWVEYSIDGGDSWHQRWRIENGSEHWSPYVVSFAEFARMTIDIRFSFYGDGRVPGKGIWLDNIYYGEPYVSADMYEDAEDDECPLWFIDGGDLEDPANASWRRTDVESHTGDWCWTLGTEDGGGPNSVENDWICTPPLWFEDPSEYRLTFWARSDTADGALRMLPERSMDGGRTWIASDLLYSYKTDYWSRYTYAVGFSGSEDYPVLWRLRAFSKGDCTGAYVYIDDFQISDDDLYLSYEFTLTPADENFIFLRNISGSGRWQVLHEGPEGEPAWVMRDSNTGSPAADDVDMLKFGMLSVLPRDCDLVVTHRRDTGPGDELRLEIWNGYYGDWEVVHTFATGDIDWTDEHIDLSDPPTNVRYVRLVYSAGGSGQGTGWKIKSLELRDTFEY